jgi:RimJ/RimL family protein N-acetyltransferase
MGSPYWQARPIEEIDFMPVESVMRLRNVPPPLSSGRAVARPMNGNRKNGSVSQAQRDQMLKLVAKGFYNELAKYGVEKPEILRVASHLLDNLMASGKKPENGIQYYNEIFNLASVKDDWRERKELSVQHVMLRPLQLDVIPKVVEWLRAPGVRESFVPAFPEKEMELQKYFTHPLREYFGVYFEGLPVGIVGGENIDRVSGKLEMKKLVSEGLQGKGIGKRATFGFLYYAFMVLNLHKVYVHSRDINLSNLNINSRFGFELEGILFEELKVGEQRQDVVRMALFRPLWVQIFSASPP